MVKYLQRMEDLFQGQIFTSDGGPISRSNIYQLLGTYFKVKCLTVLGDLFRSQIFTSDGGPIVRSNIYQ